MAETPDGPRIRAIRDRMRRPWVMKDPVAVIEAHEVFHENAYQDVSYLLKLLGAQATIIQRQQAEIGDLMRQLEKVGLRRPTVPAARALSRAAKVREASQEVDLGDVLDVEEIVETEFTTEGDGR